MPLKLVKRHNSDFWYMRGTVRGVTVDESTRLVDKEAAEALRAKREWELTQGAVFGRRATATFIEAAVKYMKRGGETRFLERISNEIGRKRLSEINQDLIDTTARKLYPNRSNSTLNRQVYAPISAVLKLAAKLELCEYRVITRLEEPPARIRWLQYEEAERLISAASKHLKPLLVFFFYTGARVSEGLYLDWSQVDLSRSHVSFLKTKNKNPRGMPLHPRVVAELTNLPHRDGKVFRRPDGLPYEYHGDDEEKAGGQIKTAFRGACRRASINDFRPHDCRHTWATWHYAANRDLIGLKYLGGWKTDRMVLRYAHVNTAGFAASIGLLPWGNSGEVGNGEVKRSTKTGA